VIWPMPYANSTRAKARHNCRAAERTLKAVGSAEQARFGSIHDAAVHLHGITASRSGPERGLRRFVGRAQKILLDRY
jgi:hypothetical protein